MVNLWTKYGEPMMYGKGETDLITKNLNVNLTYIDRSLKLGQNQVTHAWLTCTLHDDAYVVLDQHVKLDFPSAT